MLQHHTYAVLNQPISSQQYLVLKNRRAGDDMSESNSPCQSIEIATWEIVAAKVLSVNASRNIML
jgi:hypothetical protein